MNELLDKLLKEDILDDDTVNSIKESFEKQKDDAIEKAVKEAEEKTRLELSENFVKEKEQLVEALDTKAEEAIAKELTELKEDIERFRDLEVEFSEKLVEEKESLKEQYKKDLEHLVEQVDNFLEVRIDEEFTELNEDIQEVKKLQMGKKIFEAIRDEYEAFYSNGDELKAKLDDVNAQLEESAKELEEIRNERDSAKREIALENVLQPLEGRPREIMSAILSKVETEKLNEAYEQFIPKVLNESAETTEKEKSKDDVLAESNTVEQDTNERVVTGNSQADEEIVEEGVIGDAELQRLQEVAGIKFSDKSSDE